MSADPIRTTTYLLSAADALAYEQATSRVGILGALVLLVWLAACGSLALLIPLDWAGPRLSWSFNLLVLVLMAIGYVLALLALARGQLRRARKRVRRSVEMQLVEWPDRLEFSGSGLPRTVPLKDIKSGQLTRTHLFFETAGEPIVLPRRAFPEMGSIEALDARIAAASLPKPASEPLSPITEAVTPSAPVAPATTEPTAPPADKLAPAGEKPVATAEKPPAVDPPPPTA